MQGRHQEINLLFGLLCFASLVLYIEADGIGSNICGGGGDYCGGYNGCSLCLSDISGLSFIFH